MSNKESRIDYQKLEAFLREHDGTLTPRVKKSIAAEAYESGAAVTFRRMLEIVLQDEFPEETSAWTSSLLRQYG
jgi:hypothetical protein